MNETVKKSLSKVPAVTLGFWAIKILATTLGETGGDAFSMTLDLGYAVSSLIFLGVFAALVFAQVYTKKFRPLLYWSVIIATTTLGTTMADFADRSIGIGYTGGSLMLFAMLAASLGLWRWSTGSVAVSSITTPKAEMFYWATILFSQTLGTALGDWVADTNGFGYERGALVFAAGLAVIAGLYLCKKSSNTVLFWSAFILTRPLGATLGDLIDKPVEKGGFAVDRFHASALFLVIIIACILILPQKAGDHPRQGK